MVQISSMRRESELFGKILFEYVGEIVINVGKSIVRVDRFAVYVKQINLVFGVHVQLINKADLNVRGLVRVRRWVQRLVQSSRRPM